MKTAEWSYSDWAGQRVKEYRELFFDGIISMSEFSDKIAWLVKDLSKEEIPF